MAVDRYAGAAAGWACGASLVYGPIADALVARAPHRLAGRLVLDLGAGTGVGSTALAGAGARVLAVDMSHDMLAWAASSRPPSAVADVTLLPLRAASVDDVHAAFVLNHLADPVAGLREMARVARPGGAVLADVFSEASRSPVRDRVDEVAAAHGWVPPDWYTEMRESIIPLLATPERFAAAATAAGLVDATVAEAAVDVGITAPADLVDYRFGQAQFSVWQAALGPAGRDAARSAAVAAIEPIMEPYRPVVVFLVARTRS